MSPLSCIILLSPVKKPFHLNQQRNMHRSSTVYKQKQSKIVQYVGGFWTQRTTGYGLFHWRKCYYRLWTILARSSGLNWNASMDFFLANKQLLLYKMLTDGLKWCGLLVDYCYVFIRCLDSHSDGTHSQQRIHWWASDVMLNFSFLMKKQIHVHFGWLKGEYIFSNFHFWVNYSFKY